ncbi:hypothetical protein DEO72_LG4g27 [Vigna unguiculata]|uniref:Homologous recombination OB-fold protein OB-fold domain-containing protein n=1 Tax=Vigna unguiculata TaxID=3917 RepID=A0A4D6LK43_VIGUN|nr:hypothetical protein DEO72_LG4g27 [Vigna unguiculata]
MEPWEGLDVEQEDLEAFLKKCNSGATLIPGPAGNVQASMLNRERQEAQSTQEFARDVAAATYDRDFKSNAWLWAERFIHFHGLVQDGDFKNVTPLSCSKTIPRLPFVTCLVKECKPNGLGDMQICIKDQSATLWASVHKKVLDHADFGTELMVGAVLLLQGVATFTFPYRNTYLNITLRNIVKIFKPDISPPTDDLVKATVKPVIDPHPSVDPNIDNILKKFLHPSRMPSTNERAETSGSNAGGTSVQNDI